MKKPERREHSLEMQMVKPPHKKGEGIPERIQPSKSRTEEAEEKVKAVAIRPLAAPYQSLDLEDQEESLYIPVNDGYIETTDQVQVTTSDDRQEQGPELLPLSLPLATRVCLKKIIETYEARKVFERRIKPRSDDYLDDIQEQLAIMSKLAGQFIYDQSRYYAGIKRSKERTA
ncbi:hypothetical protein HYS48_00500 [Candidatus Woesearchaeota archaeon]|nr:hypothetical protein [Candidatus Woesearchaeota archaeon]